MHKQVLAQNNQAISHEKHKKFIVSMKSNKNRDVRYNSAIHYFTNEWHTTFQLQDVCYYMPNDQIKYELCLAAYPKVIDKNNFFNIYDSFATFSHAIKLYHNTQAKDGSLEFENHPDRDYASIVFPNSDGYIGLTGVNCNLPMAQNDFNYFFDSLLFDSNDNQRLDFLKQQVTSHCFSTAQIMKLGLELQLEKNRLTFLKFALDKCFDIENFIESTQLISHTYYKDDLKVFIEDYLIFISPVTDHPNNNCYINDEAFLQVLISIKDQIFSDKQKEMAKKNIEKKCFSMEQLLEIVSIFKFDKDRLEIIKFLYDYAPFPDKMYVFRNKLKFLNSKQKLDKFLIDKQ
ncbi:DUF4476 domain-containing protein [Flavivirga algicola]|uniref:DUF4476 domain-containing protein n=1 Tax=Flavivirga algicola TaxID=2729136 RepID=A0ABX1RWD8_9FLAO|nr:DUF4476 domain-containing protein [Flavivirga algicola]NMH87881.1 DUF4476 domain-containing protein [Flavivirga algicola]